MSCKIKKSSDKTSAASVRQPATATASAASNKVLSNNNNNNTASMRKSSSSAKNVSSSQRTRFIMTRNPKFVEESKTERSNASSQSTFVTNSPADTNGSQVPKNSSKIFGFPLSTYFIISNEFCERFNYFGLRTILVLYLTTKLQYDEEASIMLFHAFTTLVYLFPLVGAIVADSLLGKFKTILILSIVYAIGGIILALGAIPPLKLPVKTATIIGLVFIAFGTGGIKPCVAAFGGDQFHIPDQSAKLVSFFTIFYFAINAGSMLSTTITPILRADVHCFGMNDCFPLAFGVPALLMLLSVFIFLFGKPRYIIKPPEGNIIFGIVDCLSDAWENWINRNPNEKHKSFLDYATSETNEKLVKDVKSMLKILVLYSPLPVFWTLFDQQGSRWVFQATRMDGQIFGGFIVIKPDQMQMVNPSLVLVFIPFFDYIIYPLLNKIGISRPLQKLTMGGILAAIAFIVAAILEVKIQANEPKALSWQSAQLRFYNGMSCRYEFEFDDALLKSNALLEPLAMWSHSWNGIEKRQSFEVTAHSLHEAKCRSFRASVQLVPGHTMHYFIARSKLHEFNDEHGKASMGKPLLRTLINTQPDDEDGDIVLRDALDNEIKLNRRQIAQTTNVPHGRNQIAIDGVPAAEFEAHNGGIYAVMLHGSRQDGYKSQIHELKPPSTVSILWQLPQIIIITAAELMFSVTGLQFSFTQAPTSMKSVIQACWLLSVATGNILVVLLANIKTFNSHATEMGFFALLMAADMLCFIWLAMRYTYDDHPSERAESMANVNEDDAMSVQNVDQGQRSGSRSTDRSTRKKSALKKTASNAADSTTADSTAADSTAADTTRKRKKSPSKTADSTKVDSTAADSTTADSNTAASKTADSTATDSNATSTGKRKNKSKRRVRF